VWTQCAKLLRTQRTNLGLCLVHTNEREGIVEPGCMVRSQQGQKVVEFSVNLPELTLDIDQVALIPGQSSDDLVAEVRSLKELVRSHTRESNRTQVDKGKRDAPPSVYILESGGERLLHTACTSRDMSATETWVNPT